MKNWHYILNEYREPVPVDDVLAWAKWFEAADRRVRLTEWKGVEVSTVFLGLDHGWGSGPPLIFETMVFDAESGSSISKDGSCRRWSTWHEAEAGHEQVCREVWGGGEEDEEPERSGAERPATVVTLREMVADFREKTAAPHETEHELAQQASAFLAGVISTLGRMAMGEGIDASDAEEMIAEVLGQIRVPPGFTFNEED